MNDLPPAALGHPNASGRAAASGVPGVGQAGPFARAETGSPAGPGELRPSPFLHFEIERVYDPLRDRAVLASDVEGAALLALRDGAPAGSLDAATIQRLEEQGWLVGSATEAAAQSTASHLKYVSLEAHTVCNQSCYFCPVSIAPRAHHFMPTELYENIVSQLAAWRSTIEAVFMINYNEPTADPRFLDQVRTLRAAGLPPAVLTNASGLTPARVDALVEMGGLRFLSINLSTLDRERYRQERGQDQVDLVLRHVDYAARHRLAEQMDIVVLGTGNDAHRQDFADITARYAASQFTVKYFEVMDRAGWLEIGLKPSSLQAPLCGCDNVGSRPLQHLHITPHGKCVLCCEDYDEKYVVGDLNRQTVAEVLESPEFALLRRWVYGLEESPQDFICRACTFARR